MKCNKCGYEWITKSKHRFVSCPSCMSKQKVDNGNINIDETISVSGDETISVSGDEISMRNGKKFKIKPKNIYQSSVRLINDEEAVIDADKRHVGKKVTVIVDKQEADVSMKDWERMADKWVKKS